MILYLLAEKVFIDLPHSELDLEGGRLKPTLLQTEHGNGLFVSAWKQNHFPLFQAAERCILCGGLVSIINERL